MAKQPVPPPPHGRTPWDVLLELSGRRSLLVWACIIGWSLLAAAIFAWYDGLVPARGAKATGDADYADHLHWSFDLTSSSREQCFAAAKEVQSSAGASDTEDWINDPSEVLVVGVYGSTATAVGCAGFPRSPQSVVFVAAPDQTSAQNKEVLLRKLLNAELSR